MRHNSKPWPLSVLIATSVVLASCAGSVEDPETKTANVSLAALGTSTVTGNLTFTDGEGIVTITGTVTGLKPNAQHGFHIHAMGNCGDSTGTDGTITIGGAAGGHWNPDGHMHGAPETQSHLGDLGNLTTDDKGTASIDITKVGITIGDLSTTDAVGHSVIVHANPDDLTSQPVGNAGGRVACGIVL
jgi:Cu-Zn family superoxide dismutase